MKVPTLEELYTLKESILAKLKLKKFLKFLTRLAITPNKITSLNILIGVLSIYFLFNDHRLFIYLYVVNRLLDGLDGYFARVTDSKTALGDKLDHWGDLAIHAGLLIKSALHPNLTILAVIALGIYVGEYFLLKRHNLLHKKFPSGMFAILYTLRRFEFGLIVQISYQLISYMVFTNAQRRKSGKK